MGTPNLLLAVAKYGLHVWLGLMIATYPYVYVCFMISQVPLSIRVPYMSTLNTTPKRNSFYIGPTSDIQHDPKGPFASKKGTHHSFVSKSQKRRLTHIYTHTHTHTQSPWRPPVPIRLGSAARPNRSPETRRSPQAPRRGSWPTAQGSRPPPAARRPSKRAERLPPKNIPTQ